MKKRAASMIFFGCSVFFGVSYVHVCITATGRSPVRIHGVRVGRNRNSHMRMVVIGLVSCVYVV